MVIFSTLNIRTITGLAISPTVPTVLCREFEDKRDTKIKQICKENNCQQEAHPGGQYCIQGGQTLGRGRTALRTSQIPFRRIPCQYCCCQARWTYGLHMLSLGVCQEEIKGILHPTPDGGIWEQNPVGWGHQERVRDSTTFYPHHQSRMQTATDRKSTPKWFIENPNILLSLPTGTSWGDIFNKPKNWEGFPKFLHHHTKGDKVKEPCLKYILMGKCDNERSCFLAHVTEEVAG